MSNDLKEICDYFAEVLDVPGYYIFKTHYSDVDMYEPLGTISYVKVYYLGSEYFNPKINFNVNDKILITDGVDFVTFFLKLDDFILLIAKDIIKTLGGVLYDKDAL